VANLLLMRHSQRRVADALGVYEATISRDSTFLEGRFRRQADADIRLAKGLDLARIETLIAANWPKAIDPTHMGQTAATRVIVELLARKAAMLGYDAPQQVAQTIAVSGEAEPPHLAGLSDEDALAIYEEVRRRTMPQA
jgi:hypothetical protein